MDIALSRNNVPIRLTSVRVPPSNHFEQLSGKLQGKSSIRINDQWRLIFTWNDNKGEADGIYLDNHSYR